MDFDDILDRRYRQRVAVLNRHGIEIWQTCNAFPVQFEGKIDGQAFYFRARWGEWRLTLAETLDKAVEHGEGSITWEGDDPDDGLMPSHIAVAIIWKRLKLWREMTTKGNPDGH